MPSHPLPCSSAPACFQAAAATALCCERLYRERFRSPQYRWGGSAVLGLRLYSSPSSSASSSSSSSSPPSQPEAAIAATAAALPDSSSSKGKDPKTSFGVRPGEFPELEGWLATIGVPPSKISAVLKGLPSGLVTRLNRPGWERFLQSKLIALSRLGLSEEDFVRAIVAYPNVLALNVDMIIWKGQNLAYFLGVEIVRGEPVPEPSVNYSCTFNIQDTKQPSSSPSPPLISADPARLTITKPRSQSTQQDKRQTEKEKEKEKTTLLRDIVVKFPQILGLSLEQNVLPFLDELGCVLEVASSKELGRIVARNPSMVGCNKSRLRTRLADFEDMGFQEQEARLIMTRHPSTVMYRSETMKRKFRFLQELAREGDLNPHQFILSHPSFFGYSLEGRIIPRVAFLFSQDINLPSTSSFSTLCTYTDDKWCRLRLGINPSIYTEFKERYKASQVARALKGTVLYLSTSIRASFQPPMSDDSFFSQ